MMSSLLTTVYKDGVVQAGTMFDCPSCCQKIREGKCAQFYRSIFNTGNDDEFVRCPFGLIAYRTKTRSGEVVITGLRIKNMTPKGKSYGEAECYLPAIPESIARRLIAQHIELLNKQVDVEVKDKFVPNLIHSLSKILDVGLSQCEMLLKKIDANDAFNENILSIVNAVISARVIFNADDVRAHGVQYQTPYEMNVHGKFLKMAKLFTNFQGVRVRYTLSGDVRYRYRLLPSFECIPYLLLENARKYSPAPKEVEVRFNEDDLGLSVEVSNSGPLVLMDELKTITEYGERGKWARHVSDEGAGIGLNTVRTVAASNGLEFDVSSSAVDCQMDGVPQGWFVANLHVPISLRSVNRVNTDKQRQIGE